MENTKTLEKLRIIALLLLAALLSHVSGIGCPIRWLTGIPCAGCGMSRAILSLLTGHFRDAYAYHPMVFVLVPLCLLWLLGQRDLPIRGNRVILVRAAGSVLIVAFVIVYIIRLVHMDPVLKADITKGMIWRIIREVHYVLSVLR